MLHFIYNPGAGAGRARRCRRMIERRLAAEGVPYRFHEARDRDGAVEAVRRLTSGPQDAPVDVIAVGGDGTLHAVLNGIADPGMVRLGLIPSGSGNDFAATAGIPRSPSAALELILRGEARPTDYMECAGVRGINVIGAGIDVDILRRYARMRLLRGPVGYLAALVLTLFNFSFYDLTEEIGEARVAHSAFIACAGNGRRYGGGITICPQAVLDDGLLDIVIVDSMRKRDMPRSFAALMRRRILELPNTAFRRDAALRVRSDHALPVQIDGEIYESLPFDVRVVTGQLRMYRP